MQAIESSRQKASPLSGTEEFWTYLDQLVAISQIVVDRPKGSQHPRYPDLVYPLDYGYLEGTTTVDGDGLDVWVGSLEEKDLDAVVLTVDLKKRDAELKLLLGCSQAEKSAILVFLNGFSMRAQIVPRGNRPGILMNRRSVRRFQARPVSLDVVNRLLETATWAPSAHNRQPWRFAVLSSERSRTVLVEAMGGEFQRDLLTDGASPEEALSQVNRSRQRILEAPAAILVCRDASVGDNYPDATRQQAEHIMGVQGVAMAGLNLLLAAEAEGLGGVWMCAPLFAPLAAQRALDLPVAWQPQGLILLGYPAAIPPARPRQPLSEVARFL